MSLVERHEVSGLDDRERGFSRTAELHAEDRGYRARLRYEQVLVVGEVSESTTGAVNELVAALHARDYGQIRTRLSFKGVHYLGSQEPWVEHPDPPPSTMGSRLGSGLRRLAAWIGRRTSVMGNG